MKKHHNCENTPSETSIETHTKKTKPLAFRNSEYRIIISDLLLQASIGIYPHERVEKQPILLSLKLKLTPTYATDTSKMLDTKEILCYKELVDDVKKIVAHEHIELLEDLAEMIAQCCFNREQVQSLKLRLQKTNAIAEAKGVGIEVITQRRRNENEKSE